MEVATKNSEALLGAQLGVMNMSCEWSGKCESLLGVAQGVAKVSRERQPRVVSQNVGRGCEPQSEVANGSREIKKLGAYVIGIPEGGIN